jgi:hypothetical protein
VGQAAYRALADKAAEGDIDRLPAADLQKVRRDKHGTMTATMNRRKYFTKDRDDVYEGVNPLAALESMLVHGCPEVLHPAPPG